MSDIGLGEGRALAFGSILSFWRAAIGLALVLEEGESEVVAADTGFVKE